MPMCARCGRTVDSIEREADFGDVAFVFRAHCHGDVEEVRIPREMIEAGGKISMGVAFRITDNNDRADAVAYALAPPTLKLESIHGRR